MSSSSATAAAAAAPSVESTVSSISSSPSPSPSSSSSASTCVGSPLKAILFDVDGTLADTDYYHQLVFKDFLAPHGFKVDKEYFEHHISGKGNKEIADSHFPHLSEEEKTQMFVYKEKLFRDACEAGGIEPLAGLLTLLKSLQASQIQIAAVTNAPKPNVQMLLSAMKLLDYFPLIVLGDECEKPKPAPHPYLKACQLLNIQPENAIVFEDSPTGVRSGATAGCCVIGILTTQTTDKMKANGAFTCSKDYTEWTVEKLQQLNSDFQKQK